MIDSRELIDNLDNPEEWESDDIEGMQELIDQIGDEARYGVTLIHENEFDGNYARDLADELGMLNDSDSWPYTCIDWEQAAEDLRVDYNDVSTDKGFYAGSYLVRI